MEQLIKRYTSIYEYMPTEVYIYLSYTFLNFTEYVVLNELFISIFYIIYYPIHITYLTCVFILKIYYGTNVPGHTYNVFVYRPTKNFFPFPFRRIYIIVIIIMTAKLNLAVYNKSY